MDRISAIVASLVSLIFSFLNPQPTLLPLETPTSPPMYKSVGAVQSAVTVFAQDIQQVSSMVFTPDGNYMLVGTLPGTIWVYHRQGEQFLRQTEPFFTLKTSQPGFPPQEAGLTGIALGADFDQSGDVFLSYSFAFEKKSFRNRVTRITFSKSGKKIVGENPMQIFEASTPGTGSHQIQQGVGVMVSGKPHFMFNIGEGFVGTRALDPKEEAGKIMLIQRDGSAPVGDRPFAENPKIQAIGLRNPPAMARSIATGGFAIGDTGPNNFDRFIYGIILDSEGKNSFQVNLNWDGTEESLQKKSKNLYDGNREMILHRWAPSETPVNIAFYQNTKLPKLIGPQQYVLITLFGRTGEKTNTPGKKILLGTITYGTQNALSFVPLVERAPEGEGQLGHPLGLAVDPQTQDIYFGDIMEGKIYKVVIE